MSIFSDTFAVYERLSSAKMRTLVSQLNSHTHNGTYGVKILFSDLYGQITASQIPNNIITGAMIQNYAITNINIAPGTITTNQLDLTGIHIVDGYAVYAP